MSTRPFGPSRPLSVDSCYANNSLESGTCRASESYAKAERFFESSEAQSTRMMTMGSARHGACHSHDGCTSPRALYFALLYSAVCRGAMSMKGDIREAQALNVASEHGQIH